MLMPAIQIIKLKICFNRQRKSNSKRKREPCQEFLIELMRKRVETTFSEISTLLQKNSCSNKLWIHSKSDNVLIFKYIKQN